MWEDEILEELHQIREEHAKSFNYDFKAIFADWLQKQAASGKSWYHCNHHNSRIA